MENPPVNMSACKPQPSVSYIDLDHEEENDVRRKLDVLVNLFPDAEGDFLVTKSREFALSGEFERFVARLLDTRDYPVKAKESLEPPPPSLQCMIEGEFDLLDFLKKYDDPIKFFQNRPTSQDQHNASFMYLKFKFANKSVALLKKHFNDNNCSLIQTFRTLQHARNDRRTKRSPREVFEMTLLHSYSSYFVDEVLTIEHFDEIQEHLKNKANCRKKAIKEARSNLSLVTCGCCFEEECLIEEMLTCQDDHLFCPACVKKSIEVALGDGKVKFPCLSECSSEFSLPTIERVLYKKAMASLVTNIQLKEIQGAGIEGLTCCPFCEYAEVPPEGDRIFKCKKCKKESCIFCKKSSHIPQSCEEAAQTDARHLIEEKMSETLIRTCYQCHSNFIKIDGCNKMVCSCKAMMCYVCRKPVTDYEHFYNQKEPIAGRCPLYSKNVDLHQNEVLAAGEQAKLQLMVDNPQVTLDYDVRQEFSRGNRPCKRQENHKLNQDRYQPY